MSNSYKKNPIYKDYNKGSKTLANKRLRRINKINLKLNKELKLNFEINNSYDISDYKFIAKKETEWYKKFKRK